MGKKFRNRMRLATSQNLVKNGIVPSLYRHHYSGGNAVRCAVYKIEAPHPAVGRVDVETAEENVFGGARAGSSETSVPPSRLASALVSHPPNSSGAIRAACKKGPSSVRRLPKPLKTALSTASQSAVPASVLSLRHPGDF